MLTLILDDVVDPDALDRLRAAVKRLTRRSIELTCAAAQPSPGAMRNAAVRAAGGEYFAFMRLDSSLESSFLDHACRVLDERADVGFVSAWHDAVPLQADRAPRPCSVESLLMRPWLAHIPAVFRRAVWERLGGFDETLRAGEDLDLWLRALEQGIGGLAIEEPVLSAGPWGGALAADGARAALDAIWERHRGRIEAHAEAVLVGKERVLRELAELHRAVGREWGALDRELAAADLEIAELERLLGAEWTS